MNRPDYIKCVLTGRYIRPKDHPLGPKIESVSWCGRKIEAWEWTFNDASHAALAAPANNKVPCKECVKAIIKSLKGEVALPEL